MNENNKILKKINAFRILFIILFICVLCIIFGFSSQDATTSRSLSRRVTEVLVSNVKEIQEKPEAEKERIIKK